MLAQEARADAFAVELERWMLRYFRAQAPTVVRDVRAQVAKSLDGLRAELDQLIERYGAQVVATAVPAAGGPRGVRAADVARIDEWRAWRAHIAERVIGATGKKLLRAAQVEIEQVGTGPRLLERIRDRAGELIIDGRTASIAARNITATAVGIGTERGFDEGGVVVVEWQAFQRPRWPRRHDLLDGELRRRGDPFEMPRSAARLRWPHDPSAPAGEVINCRCALAPVVPGTQAWERWLRLGGGGGASPPLPPAPAPPAPSLGLDPVPNREGLEVVELPWAPILEQLERDPTRFVVPGGGGAEIDDRLPRARRAIRDFRASGHGFQVPHVVAGGRGSVMITDGRHRFAALVEEARRLGLERLPVSIGVVHGDRREMRTEINSVFQMLGLEVPPELAARYAVRRRRRRGDPVEPAPSATPPPEAAPTPAPPPLGPTPQERAAERDRREAAERERREAERRRQAEEERQRREERERQEADRRRREEEERKRREEEERKRREEEERRRREEEERKRQEIQRLEAGYFEARGDYDARRAEAEDLLRHLELDAAEEPFDEAAREAFRRRRTAFRAAVLAAKRALRAVERAAEALRKVGGPSREVPALPRWREPAEPKLAAPPPSIPRERPSEATLRAYRADRAQAPEKGFAGAFSVRGGRLAELSSEEQMRVRRQSRGWLAEFGVQVRDPRGWLSNDVVKPMDGNFFGGRRALGEGEGQVVLGTPMWPHLADLSGGKRNLRAADAFATLVHEELHGASPIDPDAFGSAFHGRATLIVEEVTTEVSARVITRTAFPEHATSLATKTTRKVAYQAAIDDVLDALSSVVDPEVDVSDWLERAAMRFKRRSKTLAQAKQSIEAFVDDLAAEAPPARLTPEELRRHLVFRVARLTRLNY